MNIRMKSIIVSIVSLGLAGALFAAEPPPTPAFVETWGCNYKEGKDWSDKAKARDYMVDQVEKAGLAKVPGFHWTLKKGRVPVDTVWFDIHANGTAFGAARDAWDASGIGAGVDAAFDKVEDCTAGLSVMRPIYQQEGGDDDGNSLVANLACTFKHGKGFDDIPDLSRHMGGVMQSFGDDGPRFAAVRQPITRSSNYPDLFVFSLFDIVSHWTRYVGQLFSTEAGQRMRNHSDMILDCNISLWDSQQVVTPDSD